ncbi:MAG: 4Fe-4S binding protein [Oscillospiraceae bacterium]|nr:4Fe-4S binding protein [Oscillospiraceae bacterium]
MEQEVREKPKLTPAQLKKRRNQRNAWLRAGIQAVFFFSMPGAFVAGFSGVKNIFQRIGAGQTLQWNSFVSALVGLCVFTVIFGRFFCGYVCAFGTLGDFVYWLSGLVQRKVFHRKKQLQIPAKLTPWGQKVKYVILAAIIALCAFGLYDRLSGWNPWSVFSFFMALRFRLSGYWPGLVLLLLIVTGMAFRERFFCQFLCPMGAVFALLPQMPFAPLQRKPEQCIPGCQACKRQCPVDIKLEPDGFLNGECIGSERCAGVCPKNNLTRWDRKLLRSEAAAALVKAALFFVLGVLLGLCRFITIR